MKAGKTWVRPYVREGEAPSNRVFKQILALYPLIPMPTSKVRPHIANLLLTRSPHFFHIVEMFFDRPTRRYRFQNITYFHRRVRAEIGRPTAVLEADNHHPNLAVD